MLKQSHVLSSKIEIAVEYDKPAFFDIHLNFYLGYSRFILKALRKSPFQEFLNWMLKLENIDGKNIASVNIEVFPAKRRNGFNIAGRCNTFRGKIRIYPKTKNFCHVFRKKFGKDLLVAYAGNRARASLIHELLHLKYASDEEKVRALTEMYFSEYVKILSAKNSPSISWHNLIFKKKLGCT